MTLVARWRPRGHWWGRPVVAVFVLSISAALFGATDDGLRLLLLGLSESRGREIKWVVVTQDGDCETALGLANAHARILGWSRPEGVVHLILGAAPERKPQLGAELRRAGQLRALAIGWALRARGWRRTPLLVRLSARGGAIDISDLAVLPRRE